MTYEQAEAAATANNEIIVDYLETIYYIVFAYWNTQYTKYYNIALIPEKYKGKFEAANYSEALAFARVSIKANLQPYTTADSWVSNFDTEAMADTELNKYLNEK